MGVFTKRIKKVVEVPENLSLHKDYGKTSVTIARLSYGQETALEEERFHALRAKMGDDLYDAECERRSRIKLKADRRR